MLPASGSAQVPRVRIRKSVLVSRLAWLLAPAPLASVEVPRSSGEPPTGNGSRAAGSSVATASLSPASAASPA